jgi:hypothetical protein
MKGEESMDELSQKKLLIERILPRLIGAPTDAAQQLLQKSVGELESILEQAIAKAGEAQIKADAQAEIDAMRSASRADGAWIHCVLKTQLNNKVLADTESNRTMMESLLAPHESPSAAIYETIALSYPQKFSWIVQQPAQTDAEREAEFVKICRENFVSQNDANRQLHKQGAPLDAWSAASAIERAQYQEEAAQARQKYLIHEATPEELRQAARYEFQTGRDAAVQADAKRREELVAEAQRGLYAPLPAVNANGEVMDAKYFRRISTVNYELFRALVKRHGSAQITARLRGE